MDIQTQKERNPPVRNIRRDSIETQTHTEQFTNQAGLKTEKESSIHSLHAEDTAEPDKKTAAAGTEDMPEEAEDSEDSDAETGIARKTDSPVTSIDKKRRKAAKKKESDSELDNSPVAEDEENGGSDEVRTNNTIPGQADNSTSEDSREPEDRDTIPIIIENDSDNSESDNSGEVRTNNTIPVQPDKSEPETEAEETTPIVDNDDSDSGEIINNNPFRCVLINRLTFRKRKRFQSMGFSVSSPLISCNSKSTTALNWTAKAHRQSKRHRQLKVPENRLCKWAARYGQRSAHQRRVSAKSIQW